MRKTIRNCIGGLLLLTGALGSAIECKNYVSAESEYYNATRYAASCQTWDSAVSKMPANHPAWKTLENNTQMCQSYTRDAKSYNGQKNMHLLGAGLSLGVVLAGAATLAYQGKK